MRFSAAGMWGIAVYFAVNSVYSNDYHYQVPRTNQKQMFYARVLVANYKELMPDRTLRVPPLINQNLNHGERYDSVKGFTNNSEVFMIYANRKAYPEYLITYKS